MVRNSLSLCTHIDNSNHQWNLGVAFTNIMIDKIRNSLTFIFKERISRRVIYYLNPGETDPAVYTVLQEARIHQS